MKIMMGGKMRKEELISIFKKETIMNLADLLKKNIVMVPVVASVLVGTFTGVKYIVNLNRYNQMLTKQR